MKFSLLFAIFISITLDFPNSATASTATMQRPLADSVFFGGDILTMDSEQPEYAEALVVSVTDPRYQAFIDSTGIIMGFGCDDAELDGYTTVQEGRGRH